MPNKKTNSEKRATKRVKMPGGDDGIRTHDLYVAELDCYFNKLTRINETVIKMR
jgi:hypothetical protein